MKNWWAEKEEFLSDYIKAQTSMNEAKFTVVWVKKVEVMKMCEYMKKELDSKSMSFGLCHGSRNGKEVSWFRRFLKVSVVGTDISETARKIKNLVVWDFNVENEEWVGACDFVYSNSIDHTYDLGKCLNVWERQLKDGGLCFVHMNVTHFEEHRDLSRYYSPGDCFTATKKEYEEAFENTFVIRDFFKTIGDRFVYVLGKKCGKSL